MDSNLKKLSIQIALNKNINLSTADKSENYILIQKLIQLAIKVRREGLLDIENIETEHFMLKKGIQLITSGTDPLIVEEILSKLIISGNYEGKELVSRLIIMDGILGIQYGENPQRLYDNLSAWLGEEFNSTYLEYAGDRDLMKKIEQVRERLNLND